MPLATSGSGTESARMKFLLVNIETTTRFLVQLHAALRKEVQTLVHLQTTELIKYNSFFVRVFTEAICMQLTGVVVGDDHGRVGAQTTLLHRVIREHRSRQSR